MNQETRESRVGEETEGLGNTETFVLPERWDNIPVMDYLKKGFRPTKKKVKDHFYITLKKSKFEKSLGPFNDVNWTLINKLYEPYKIEDKPNLEYLSTIEGELDKKKEDDVSHKLVGPKGVLGIKIKRPIVIPTSFTPTLNTMSYFYFMRTNGYEGSFEEFVNDIIRLYFERGCTFDENCKYRNSLSPGFIFEVESESDQL